MASIGSNFKQVGLNLKNIFTGTPDKMSSPTTMSYEQNKFLADLMGSGSKNLQTITDQLMNTGQYTPDTLNQLFSAGGNSYTDVNRGDVLSNARQLTEAGMQGIDYKLSQDMGNALHGGERFSTANTLLRGRLAGEAAMAKSQLLANVFNQELGQARSGMESLFGRQMQTQQMQFGQAQQNIANKLQGQQMGQQGIGSLLNLYGAGLGQKSFENIYKPGEGSIFTPSNLIGGAAVAAKIAR